MLNIKHEKSERMSINLNINNFFLKKYILKKTSVQFELWARFGLHTYGYIILLCKK